MSLGRSVEEWCGCLWWNTKGHLNSFYLQEKERKQPLLERAARRPGHQGRVRSVTARRWSSGSVLKIQGIFLVTDSEFRGHNERVSKVGDEVRGKEVRAMVGMKVWGWEVTWESWLLVASVLSRDEVRRGVISGGLTAQSSREAGNVEHSTKNTEICVPSSLLPMITWKLRKPWSYFPEGQEL